MVMKKLTEKQMVALASKTSLAEIEKFYADIPLIEKPYTKI
jgi:hypothetical protein